MTEETAAAFHREGENAFAGESTEEDTSADSHSEDDNQEEETRSPGGENTQDEDDKKPFHEHPRWIQREGEWTKRFNDQETRHQDDIAAIRKEFGGKRDENTAQTKIPAWFGGTQEQWDAYRADRDLELKQAADTAIERLTTDREAKVKEEEKAVADATNYMRSELAEIEADKTLNPSGAKIDAQKLLKVVLDEQLIDTKGRWNYRAGMKILNGSQAAPAPKPKPTTTEKKEVADATIDKGGSSGEAKSRDYKVADDFKKPGARPW